MFSLTMWRAEPLSTKQEGDNKLQPRTGLSKSNLRIFSLWIIYFNTELERFIELSFLFRYNNKPTITVNDQIQCAVRCLFFYDFFICSDILTEGSRHYSKTFDTIWEVNKPIPVVRYCLG